VDSMDDRTRPGQDYGHDVIGDELLSIENPAPAPRISSRATEPPVRIEQPSRSRWRLPLMVLGVLALLAGGTYWYLQGGRYESTEDAFLQAGQAAVASNVSGQVVAIEVDENQAVRAGQILFRIDPRPFQTAVDEAQAQLADARAQVQARRASFYQDQAEVQSAQAKLAYALNEAARQQRLLGKGISSQAQYDQAALEVKTSRQAVQTSTQQTEGVRAALSGNVALPVDSQPSVQAAQAALDRARLNLGYATVTAAMDGIVTRVNQLQLGNYVTASRPAFTLVGRRLWVEANFKESQLRHMRLGQPATITVDAFSDRPLRAHVASFSPGTGNSFALLPAENANGNWVKVVQRLAVDLDLDQPPADLDLHAGLSATVSVDTGHVRHLMGPDTHTDTRAAP
jgi:membrane fusion protein (multidrug efflux system)